MNISAKSPKILVLAACAILAACSSPDPVAYRGVASASYLKPNAQDESGRIPYRYSNQVDWHSFDKAIIDPVEIYRGSDNQFGDMSEEDKLALAQYMQLQFTTELGKRFSLANTAGAKTLRIRLTLTGADTNTPVLSTFTRFDLSGGLYNAVQAARGREGVMTGSVIYVVEIYDSASGQLLDSMITKQYPGAYNVGATFGSLGAAKTGIEKGATTLAEELK